MGQIGVKVWVYRGDIVTEATPEELARRSALMSTPVASSDNGAADSPAPAAEATPPESATPAVAEAEATTPESATPAVVEAEATTPESDSPAEIETPAAEAETARRRSRNARRG